MKDHTFSVPCMIITDFVMEARPFFESQIKIKDSSRYLLSKIPVLQQSAVGSSLVGEFSLCTSGPSECDKVDSQDNYDQLKAFLTRTSDETLDLECSRLATARQEGRSLLKELENHVKLNVFSGAEKEDMESFRNGVFYAIDAVRHLWVELLQSAVGNCVQLHIPSSTLHAEYCKLMTSKSAKNIKLTMIE